MSEHAVITQLAEQCLNKEGQEEVATLLLDNETERAKIYILGAIDGLWFRKQISDSEATEAYRTLGIKPEEASRLRQDSPCWK